MVVPNWLVPPPMFAGSSQQRTVPAMIAPAPTYPFSIVRRPTTPLTEKVSPGITRYPWIVSAMRWILMTRFLFGS